MTQLVATLVMIFAPLGQLARLWRALIAYVDGLNAILTDEQLSQDLDDPHARAWAERYIAMAEDGIAILITQRTRELLGLSFQRLETRQPAHLPHPPSRHHLLARHARMLASLSTIERAAQTRATRIRREQQGPLRLDASHRSTSPALRAVEATRLRIASTTPREWGRWHARTYAHDGGGSMQPRAPPDSNIANFWKFTSAASRLRSPPHAQTQTARRKPGRYTYPRTLEPKRLDVSRPSLQRPRTARGK